MAQHGAYMLLLWEYYINGPFLANASDLLNVCCAKTEAEALDVTYVLERFFYEEDGFWHHKRADEEIKKRESIRNKRKLVGKQGGLAKASRLLQQNASKRLDNHNHNHKEEPTAKAPSAFVMPDWLPKEAWGHYEEMRRRIRKPMTDQARIWAVAKLETIRTQGQDPSLVLEQSVFNSWQGLFPLKGELNDRHKTTAQLRNERASAAIERAFAEVEAAGDVPAPLREGVGRG